MFSVTPLLTAVLLAISLAASPIRPPITLPLAKKINTSGGAINLVQHDQARYAALMERGRAAQSDKLAPRDGSIGVANTVFQYVAAVGVGTPYTVYYLLVDTGSSNTWIGASKPYTPTSTSTDTGSAVSKSYGIGPYSSYFSGEEWLDTVTLSDDLVITQQSIGVAAESRGMNPGLDGIIGIGPADNTIGSLANDPNAEIPTVTDNLYQQGTISTEVVSVLFAPTTANDNVNGELTFGGTDPSQYTGDITYTPITSTSPASGYWGIDQSIAYGDQTILSTTAGIVDTGTTLILIASDAYEAYQSLTGATVDSATNLLSLTASQYGNLQNLNFIVGSTTYTLIPDAQIWPRALNTYLHGGTSDAIYSVIGSTEKPSGQGFDFLNGQMFLERFYSVYDTTNQQVGFAMTQYTNAIINGAGL